MLRDNSLRFSVRSQQVATEFSTAARRIQSLVRPPSLEIVPACFGGAFWGRLGDWDDSAAWIDPPPLAAMVEQSVACGRGRTIEVDGQIVRHQHAGRGCGHGPRLRKPWPAGGPTSGEADDATQGNVRQHPGARGVPANSLACLSAPWSSKAGPRDFGRLRRPKSPPAH